MKDFPSCFGANGVQIADSSSSNSSKTAQNLVACVYRCRIRGRHCLITVTWTKNLMGQGLSVEIDHESTSSQCLCKVDIKPFVFSKRKGCKSLESCSCKIDVHWDLSSAKFGSRPEPSEGFYVGVVVDQQMILLLGDLRKEALKKTNTVPLPSNAVLVAKKEHVFGKLFGTKAVFCDNGPIHDLVIKCDTTSVTDPSLIIRIDNRTVMQVNRLRWKFRGNHTIMIDGLAVEVFWDVHNMLFDTPLENNAIFMFRTCFSDQNSWAIQPFSDANILQRSFPERFSETKSQDRDFSLILYAWKNMHGCRNSNT
ncbi:hypothetical protein TanjilG_22637 [Lupinus angustifolius]|uniref:DUF868 domain-containing protein n=2 Tax=Lupinus angustifolius TaxID=3871 RepID=A0A4P1RT92_LUPAN|nr:hypothetical protein TanjilG_22637 [Lupinus angustifolius]